MQKAIELNNNNSAAMVDLALLELNAGRIDQAFYWNKRALPLAPNLANTYYHLGLSVIFADTAVAERLITAAARRFPMMDPTGGARLQMLLAVLDLRRGRAAAAVERLRQVETAYPGNSEVTLLLDEFAVYAETADAAQRLDRALKTSASARGWWAPYSPRTLRAFVYTRAGQPERARPLIDEALTEIRKARAAGDRTYAPLYEEAALQLMLGQRETALDLVEKSIDAGFAEQELPKVDPLIAGLRSEPRFVAAVQRIERLVAEMRQRMDLSDLDRLNQ
jgi:tetratricopeptide (TPR) repeat protein